MSTPVVAAASIVGAGRGRWVRASAVVLVSLATLAVLVLLAIVRQPDDDGIRTDPSSARPSGSKALVEVLRERGGVRVVVATTTDDLRAARLDEATTLVVSDTAALGSSPEMAGLVGRLGRLVLVEPDNQLLQDLAVPAERVGRTPMLAESRCDGDLQPGWRVDGGAILYRPLDPTATGSGGPPLTCLSPPPSPLDNPEGPAEPTAARGAYLLLPGAGDAPDTVLLGTDEVLLNGSITRADHAGFALRVLGHHPRLVWYLPTPLPAGRPEDAVVPPWFQPGVLALAGACVGLVVWRGRRFGRLSVEPLLAVVPATETTQARGRLYQRAGEPGRALELLRAATARRLRNRLGIQDDPGDPVTRDLVGAVAHATGRDRSEVVAALEPPLTRSVDETTLVREAQLLEQLEREVAGR